MVLVDKSEHLRVLNNAIAHYDHLADSGVILPRTTPRLWVLNSGNAGSTYLAELLNRNNCPRVEHEYAPMVNGTMLDLDNEGVRYYLQDCDFDYVATLLHFTRSHIITECSNRLFSMALPLKFIFPNSQFIHLVRDNRTTLSKVINLTANESANETFLRTKDRRLRYATRLSGPVGASLFEQSCWYWKNINERIFNDLEELSAPILFFDDLIAGDISLFEQFFNKKFELEIIEKINASKETRTSSVRTNFGDWPSEYQFIWEKICGETSKRLGF